MRIAAAVAAAIVFLRVALFLAVYFGHSQTAFFLLQGTQMGDCICTQAYIWIHDPPLLQVLLYESCSTLIPAAAAFALLAFLLRKSRATLLGLSK